MRHVPVPGDQRAADADVKRTCFQTKSPARPGDLGSGGRVGTANGQRPDPTGSRRAKELGLCSKNNGQSLKGLKPVGLADPVRVWEIPRLCEGGVCTGGASISSILSWVVRLMGQGAREVSPWLSGCRAGRCGCQERGQEPEEELRLCLWKMLSREGSGQTRSWGDLAGAPWPVGRRGRRGGGRSRGVGREEEGQSHRTPAGPRGQDVCSLHCLGGNCRPVPRSWVSAHLPDRGAPLPGGDPAGLTSRGEQVAVEGDVSLAHGQEVCTNIWGDRGQP